MPTMSTTSLFGLRSLKAFALGIAFAGASAFAAPTLITVDAGAGYKSLLGADSVVVDGLVYNVRFKEGSCTTLFAGCVTSAFTFHDSTTALLAAQALLNTVFLDLPNGQIFDSYTFLTFGCSSTSFCFTHTPYDVGVNHAGDKELFSAVARNFDDGVLPNADEASNLSFDQIGPDCDTSDTNFFSDKCLGFTSIITLNYAVWTLQETRSEVSEPATLALAGVSLLALAGNRRKRLAMAAG